MEMNKHNLPIGVFDSGVGGLTVLRALQQHLPNESFIYLGDTARLPYGTKSSDTIARYTRQASQVLVDRGIKLLVVACNTATALGLPYLREGFPDLKIVGVIEPGAQAACEVSHNGHIAVIATEATVNAKSYQNAIQELRPDSYIVAQGCSLLVALAEEGWNDGPIAEAIVRRYLEPLLKSGENGYRPDCLVLACTHFPALLTAIRQVVDSVNPKIEIVDSAQTTAQTVVATLKELDLGIHLEVGKSASTHFLVTDAPERFARVAKQFLGMELSINQVELVDVSTFMATTPINLRDSALG
jgi:glutamate racemase